MTANQVQIRRDSAANIAAATPALGELGYDTTNKRLILGDGTTSGGIKLPNRNDIQGQTFLAAAATGTDTITVTLTFAPASYSVYQRFVFKAQNTNTGSATININSLGAKTIKIRTTSGVANLSGGEIIQDGVYAVVYDGTYMQLEDYTQSGGSGDFVKLATATASASATLDFASVITADYSSYLFIFKNLRPATDDADLIFRTSTNNGSSFNVSGGDYCWRVNGDQIQSSLSSISDSNLSAGGINLTGTQATAGIGNLSSEGVSGKLWLINPLNSAQRKGVYFDTAFVNRAAFSCYTTGSGFRLSTADIDAARFQMSTGNITSGEINLYGLKA